MRFRFRFRVIPFLATVILVAAGVSLAQWQTRRGDEKMAMDARMQARQAAPAIRLEGTGAATNPDEIEYRRVLLKGEFLSNWPVYLDNRPHNGVAGFYLLMPFKIAATNLHVLVARGWIPRNASDRTQLPALVTPQGTIEIEGTVRQGIGHIMQLGSPEPLRPAAIVQNLDAAGFAATSGLKMQPVIVEQLTDTHDGLVRDWPAPASGVEKHRGYAFQWYALAAMAFIFFVVTGFRRGSK
ncbi:MAG TPA: SURF1 family protein [Oxalicibacterium sp.]|uniref:SURF1 family protein n=1 Tax=Oxalicibacterium sp. TaxID=2766525 RepID=UPI002C92AF1E|nr:SURF1 family protein [Oxalicibacterium sp.]HWU99014.1 SURF1 family protein [Oxalicibacterium sp.]